MIDHTPTYQPGSDVTDELAKAQAGATMDAVMPGASLLLEIMEQAEDRGQARHQDQHQAVAPQQTQAQPAQTPVISATQARQRARGRGRSR